jgi:TPR repeat protein
VNESDKPLFLYQDDNDYTYISLVRHLPFVPNFTYIYGFDRLRGFHCLLPLYGVADGYLFGKRYFSGSARQSLPINMLGVRLGQAATGIAHISSSILFSIPAILVAIAFFAMYISYSAEASIEAYAVSFTAFLAALVAFYAFPWIALKIMTTRFLSFPFTANIIKPGLLFLAGAYLFRHYAVYSYAGVLPSLCGLLTFYLLFVRTKYPPEKKQIVAQVSSLNNLPDSKSRVTDLPQGLKALYLGKEMTRSRNKLHLFYNDEYVVLTRKVLGMTLYYDVINLTTAFKISLMEIPGGTRLRVSTYNFDIHESVSELQKACEAASLPGEITTFKEPNRSKIPLNQLGVLASLWVLWQFAIVFAHPGYTPVESPASTKYLDTAVKNLVTTGNHWTHRQEGVSYSKSIDLEKKEIVFWHKNSVTWEEFEEAVRRKSSAAAVGPTTRALPSPESSEFLLPSFIKKDGFRDDVIEFLGWQLLTRWQRVDPLRYGQELEVYCKNFGAVALNRAKDLICAFPFRFEDALQWIRTEKKVPEIFDIEIIRELAGIDGGILAFSPALARLDRETLVRGVSMNGMFLQYAAPELRRDKRLVMMAINQDYNAYRFMDPIFYRDGVIVSKLVEHDGMLLKHASENLKKKRSLVLKAAIQNYQAYQFMDPEFWKDREICMHLLTKDGLLLEYLDKDLRDEDRLVKVAIMQNGKALQFATERYKKDRSIASLALQNDPSAWIFLDPDLYEHRDLAIQMLRMDGLQLENLSEKFRREPDVVLVAIEQNFRAFLSMDSSLWRDRRVVAKILEKQGLALEFVDEELRKDRQLLLTALEQNGLSLEFVPVDLRSDRDLILTAVNSNGEGLRFAPRKARRDLEIVLAAARQNLNALRYGYLSEEWMIAQSDKDNPMAQVCLGYHFMEGIRFSKNANRARELLTRAAERGLSLAQRTLAFLYLNSPRGRGDLDRAWKWLEAAAEQGDLEAMTRIGQLHEQGMAVFKDVSKALKWYLKAAELGYPQAQYLVGKVLDVYPDSDLKPSNPIYWYEHSAESGYLLSQIILGERYFLGNGVEVNSSRAVSWFAQAGRRGDTSSQVHLGVLYGHGIGVEKSWTKAVDWFEQSMRNGVEFPGCLIARGSPKTSGPGAGVALKTWFLEEAEKGDATAQCVIGVMLEKGEWETKSNPEEAYSWFQKSAQSGNPEGQNRLGMAYLRGMGIDRNSEEAFQWFQMAANTGYSSAQTNLGKVLEKGVGVIKDEAKAVEWYRKAAIQDHAEAQVSLGTLYELGRGVNRDYSQATSWYEKAAIQGHAAAQTNLGMMYEFGKGIQKSEESAIQWYRKAALQKDQRAIRTLKFMKERGVFIEDGY